MSQQLLSFFCLIFGDISIFSNDGTAPLYCEDYAGGPHHPAGQTTTWLGQETCYPAPLKLYQKSHPQTFALCPWWTIILWEKFLEFACGWISTGMDCCQAAQNDKTAGPLQLLNYWCLCYTAYCRQLCWQLLQLVASHWLLAAGKYDRGGHTVTSLQPDNKIF